MESRELVKAKTDTTTQIYLTMASNLSYQMMSSLGTTLSSGLMSAYQYLTTPSPSPLLLKAPKARAKTSYEANVTASMALPDRPKQKLKACKQEKTAYPEAPSSMTVILNSVTAFFSYPFTRASVSTTPTPDLQPQPIVKTKSKKKTKSTKSSSEDIDVKMIALVKAFKDLKDPLHQDYGEAEKILLDQIDLVEHEIMEHAERRVDLYFYMLVAVYQKNALIEKKSTNKQHGSGTNERGTNGCHDSLFPHVKLRYPKSTAATLWSIVSTPPSIRGTHFEDANNMTTELPKLVNDFDTYLELSNPGHQSGPSKYVKNCLEDLNLASQGKITPIDGMNRFFKNMKTFFNDFEQKNLQNGSFAYPKVMKKIWELQFVATLRAQAFESDTVDLNYVGALLRIPPNQMYYYIKDPTALLKQCSVIQNEIYATPSTVDQARRLKK